jgi:ribosomal protein L32
MAQPKVRKSKGAKGRRRSHLNQKVVIAAVIKCANCGRAKKPHTVCKNCSTY